MIIIDQDTEAKLATKLERMKAESESARCIYFQLKNDPPADINLKEKVIASLRRHIPSVDIQIFFCADGDIFVLAPLIPSKDGREFILEIAAYLGRPADEGWERWVELPLHIHLLLVEVEAKLERRRKAEEAKRKLHEQQQAERKRQAILSGGTASTQTGVEERRAARKAPEMMLIEDDTFSRKLVENVLRKHYPLTALSEATHALDTYARLAPDVLFLDINLPDVTGHELLEKIIALDPRAYVIMLSGNADKENITQAMSKGAKGFVAKPFTKDKLFQYIERCPTLHH